MTASRQTAKPSDRPVSGPLKNVLQGLCVAAFFAGVFLFFLHPIKPGDFWWHISLGRWIVENGSLITAEPLTYTSPGAPTAMEALHQRGYWLAQTLYYLTYSASGFRGVAAINAALHAGIFLTLWLVVRRMGIGVFASLLLIAPSIVLMSFFDEVRPHTFSFLIVLLVYYSLASGVNALRTGPPRGMTSPTQFLYLIPLMLVWANLHQGFIIGYGIIGIYLCMEGARILLNRKDALSPAAYLNLLFWSALGIAVTLLNPNHITAPITAVMNLFNLTSIGASIIEQGPPWSLFEAVHAPAYLYGSLALALITLAIVASNYRSLRAEHALMFFGFALAGAKSARFLPFFLVMAIAIAAPYAAILEGKYLKRLSAVFAALALIFAAYLAFISYRPALIPESYVYTEFVPGRAADFMERHDLPQPIFNPFEWGGYLAWRLNPRYLTFTDARIMDYEVYDKYLLAKQGMRKGVFSEYDIKTVVFYPIYPLDQIVQPIVLSLMKDTAWDLVLSGENSVIFIRGDANPGIPRLDKREHMDALIRYGMGLIEKAPQDPKGHSIVGAIYFTLGEYDNAKLHLDRASALGAK